MANKNLIRGAAMAYAPTFVDAGQSLGLSGAGRSRGISPSALNRLANMRSVDSQVKAYIDSLNTEMDLVGLSEMEDLSVRAYLNNQKQEYLEAATLLAQTDPTSSEYVNLKAKMDGIKTGFTNLKGQIDKFKERKIQYLDDFENGRISKGNKEDDYYDAGKAYGGGALYIDQNGGLNMYVDGGKRKIDYSNMKDPFLKDFKTADEILQQNNKLYTAGVKLDTSKEALLRNQLKNQLSRDGALESIVEDGLITNERLNVDLDAYATREDAINDVAEILLQGYRDSAAAGAEEKRIRKGQNKPTGSSDTVTNPEGTYLGYDRNTEQDKVNFEKNWNATQSTAATSAEIMNTEAKDKSNKIEYYRSKAPGSAIFGKNGKLTEPPRESEVYVQKWYSSYDSKKYGGEAKTNQRWQLAPAIKWTKDGYVPVTIWRRNSESDWQVLTEEDYKKEFNGTAGVKQTNTTTTTGRTAADFNKPKGE